MITIKILTDLHCHTVASTHAYSTITENADVAAQKGLQAIAITDHGPGCKDGAHLYHFQNLSVLPRRIKGVIILRGAECTFQNADGDLDLDDKVLAGLDIVIASMHQNAYFPADSEEHTSLLLRVLDNPYVHIMGHIGREKTQFDIERVVKKAKETKKLIEINSSSLVKGWGRERCIQVAKICKEHSLPIVATSDSHYCSDVGNVEASLQLLRDIGYDEELIVNSTFEKLEKYLWGNENVFRD